MAERLRKQISSVLRRVADFFWQPLYRFVSRSPNNSGQPRDESRAETVHPGYQRDFRRYPIELNVSVQFQDEGAPPDADQGELQDISGGGALFVPCHPERYYVGQKIEAIIYLASTQDVQACIRSEATVVRIEPLEESQAGETVCVAVRFEQTFDFERIDSRQSGMGE